MTSDTQTNHLILYIGLGCPFCTRVTDFIEDNNISINVINVWDDEDAFEEMFRLSGCTQVPCLRMGDSYMLESLDIIDKLKALFSID